MKEITFKDLQQANQTIKTMDIKGKDYAEVNQRIKAFRMVYPEGFILTTLLADEQGKCVFQARVGYYKDGNEMILGTGNAFELQSSSFINKTSYLENCETSAVGRALGMAGFGIDTSVASYEEVANAVLNQDKKPAVKKADANPMIAIHKEIKDCKTSEEVAAVWKKYTDLHSNIEFKNAITNRGKALKEEESK